MASSLEHLNGQGLDLSNIDKTTPDEINAYLSTRWKGRGPLYDQYAMSLMLDYAPDFAKLHWWAAEVFRTLPSAPDVYDPVFATPNSIQQLHSYMVLGWETGIRNQFRVLRRLGFTRAQMMEIVMFGRLVAGMRGLELVPIGVGLAGFLPEVFGNQFILGREVPVKRHLVGAGGLGDGLDPDRPDAVVIKQLPGGRQKTCARRNSLVLIET